MKFFYKTSATATGGRDGRTQVDDGSIGFDLVSFQNESGKHGTNPEQLFAMGYAACFDSAMNHVAPTLGLNNEIFHYCRRGHRSKTRWCIRFGFGYHDYRSRFD